MGGYEGWGGYGSSKAALDLVSRTLAAELSSRGVSVVSVDQATCAHNCTRTPFPVRTFQTGPPPEVTLPFWLWLLNQRPGDVSGHRFRAQADTWTLSEKTQEASPA